MANENPNKISQIQVGNITYDIVDPVARDLKNDKLNSYCVFGPFKSNSTTETTGITMSRYYTAGADANFANVWNGFVVWGRITYINVKAKTKTATSVDAYGGITDKELLVAKNEFKFLRTVGTTFWQTYEGNREGGFLSGGTIKWSRAQSLDRTYNIAANTEIQIVSVFLNQGYFTNPYPEDVPFMDTFYDSDNPGEQ